MCGQLLQNALAKLAGFRWFRCTVGIEDCVSGTAGPASDNTRRDGTVLFLLNDAIVLCWRMSVVEQTDPIRIDFTPRNDGVARQSSCKTVLPDDWVGNDRRSS